MLHHFMLHDENQEGTKGRKSLERKSYLSVQQINLYDLGDENDICMTSLCV